MISLSDLTKKLKPKSITQYIFNQPDGQQYQGPSKPPSSTPLGPSDCLNDEDEVEPDDDGAAEKKMAVERKWVPNFIPDNEPIKVLTAWVTIPHLPVAYFDMEFLKKVGSKIVHETNGDGDINNPHIMEENGNPPCNNPEMMAAFGSWMLVKEPVRRRQPRPKKHLDLAPKMGDTSTIQNLNFGAQQNNKKEGSRFTVLIDENNGQCENEGDLAPANQEATKNNANNAIIMEETPNHLTVGLGGQSQSMDFLTFNLRSKSQPNKTFQKLKTMPNLKQNSKPKPKSDERNALHDITKTQNNQANIINPTTWDIEKPNSINRNHYSGDISGPISGHHRPLDPHLRDEIRNMDRADTETTGIGGDRAEQIGTIIGYQGHVHVDAIGFSGGIWVYWRPEEVTIDPISYSNQCITMEIKRVEGEPWFFSVVYASPDPTKRKDLWNELQDFAF
ncbi:PHD finger protein 20-like protein 1 [Bienertia sinuspersici]